MKKIFALTLLCILFQQTSIFAATEFSQQTTEKFEKMGLDLKTVKTDMKVDRADFIVTVTNLMGYTKKDVKEYILSKNPTSFKDCEGTWYNDSFKVASYLGIIFGSDDGSAKPASIVTRQEMIVLLSRTFGISVNESDNTKTSFSDDANIDNWAKPYVAFALKNGYISPDSKNNFNPKENITKGELLLLTDKILGDVILDSENYLDKHYTNNVTVFAKGATFENIVIDGNLFVTLQANDLKTNNVVVNGNVAY